MRINRFPWLRGVTTAPISCYLSGECFYLHYLNPIKRENTAASYEICPVNTRINKIIYNQLYTKHAIAATGQSSFTIFICQASWLAAIIARRTFISIEIKLPASNFHVGNAQYNNNVLCLPAILQYAEQQQISKSNINHIYKIS